MTYNRKNPSVLVQHAFIFASIMLSISSLCARGRPVKGHPRGRSKIGSAHNRSNRPIREEG
ncbi:hypothetical protein BDV40DRAFT_259138 [Aspergillus tamarii]|uniref:Uncharacterized protein n=1 Tax=Aspergillus tamarii TaxID=41984 RepID=A0A5N6V223_ASPTM|nr:hypothetical protein BDV40DRAFT_259138 [Aspergillus tamarii]